MSSKNKPSKSSMSTSASSLLPGERVVCLIDEQFLRAKRSPTDTIELIECKTARGTSRHGNDMNEFDIDFDADSSPVRESSQHSSQNVSFGKVDKSTDKNTSNIQQDLENQRSNSRNTATTRRGGNNNFTNIEKTGDAEEASHASVTASSMGHDVVENFEEKNKSTDGSSRNTSEKNSSQVAVVVGKPLQFRNGASTESSKMNMKNSTSGKTEIKIDRRVFGLSSEIDSCVANNTQRNSDRSNKMVQIRQNREEIEYWLTTFRDRLQYTDAITGCCCNSSMWADLVSPRKICAQLAGLKRLICFYLCHICICTCGLFKICCRRSRGADCKRAFSENEVDDFFFPKDKADTVKKAGYFKNCCFGWYRICAKTWGCFRSLCEYCCCCFCQYSSNNPRSRTGSDASNVNSRAAKTSRQRDTGALGQNKIEEGDGSVIAGDLSDMLEGNEERAPFGRDNFYESLGFLSDGGTAVNIGSKNGTRGSKNGIGNNSSNGMISRLCKSAFIGNHKGREAMIIPLVYAALFTIIVVVSALNLASRIDMVSAARQVPMEWRVWAPLFYSLFFISASLLWQKQVMDLYFVDFDIAYFLSEKLRKFSGCFFIRTILRGKTFLWRSREAWLIEAAGLAAHNLDIDNVLVGNNEETNSTEILAKEVKEDIAHIKRSLRRKGLLRSLTCWVLCAFNVLSMMRSHYSNPGYTQDSLIREGRHEENLLWQLGPSTYIRVRKGDAALEKAKNMEADDSAQTDRDSTKEIVQDEGGALQENDVPNQVGGKSTSRLRTVSGKQKTNKSAPDGERGTAVDYADNIKQVDNEDNVKPSTDTSNSSGLKLVKKAGQADQEQDGPADVTSTNKTSSSKEKKRLQKEKERTERAASKLMNTLKFPGGKIGYYSQRFSNIDAMHSQFAIDRVVFERDWDFPQSKLRASRDKNPKSTSFWNEALTERERQILNPSREGTKTHNKPLTWCYQCNMWKPTDNLTHHCSVCNKCVMGRDHHCPHVANCVGAGNYKFFVMFLFWCVVWSIFMLYTILFENFPIIMENGKTFNDSQYEYEWMKYSEKYEGGYLTKMLIDKNIIESTSASTSSNNIEELCDFCSQHNVNIAKDMKRSSELLGIGKDIARASHFDFLKKVTFANQDKVSHLSVEAPDVDTPHYNFPLKYDWWLDVFFSSPYKVHRRRKYVAVTNSNGLGRKVDLFRHRISSSNNGVMLDDNNLTSPNSNESALRKLLEAGNNNVFKKCFCGCFNFLKKCFSKLVKCCCCCCRVDAERIKMQFFGKQNINLLLLMLQISIFGFSLVFTGLMTARQCSVLGTGRLGWRDDRRGGQDRETNFCSVVFCPSKHVVKYLGSVWWKRCLPCFNVSEAYDVDEYLREN